MNLVFLGPPGAGKGTQAQKLADEFGWPHLSSGDILRAEAQAGSELGKQAAGYMQAGRLVPDELIVDLMVDRVMRADCRDGFILDGFPRTDVQARALDRALGERGLALDAVVYFACGDEEVVRRITGRRSCPSCGAVYHVESLPPRLEGVCDRCGTALAQRSDDTAPVVRERLATYRRQTEPLIEHYGGQGKLCRIDAEQSIQAINAELNETVARVGRPG